MVDPECLPCTVSCFRSAPSKRKYGRRQASRTSTTSSSQAIWACLASLLCLPPSQRRSNSKHVHMGLQGEFLYHSFGVHVHVVGLLRARGSVGGTYDAMRSVYTSCCCVVGISSKSIWVAVKELHVSYHYMDIW